MYRRSLSNLLGGSLLVASVTALNACGGAAGDDTSAPTAGSTGTPTSGAAATPGSTGAAGKTSVTPSTTASAGAKAPGGTMTSGVTSAAGKSGGAGSSAAAAGSTGAAGGGTSAAAGSKAAAGSTGGAAGGTAAAAGSTGATGAGTLGSPLKYTGAFTMGMTIPAKNKCPTAMGDNKSPALSWTGGPADTKSFALVLYDTGFMMLHYALWDIPATVNELPEGLAAGYELTNPMGAHQAAAMCNNAPAYCGPCSGTGAIVPASTYEYRLYALKVDKLGLTASSTAAQAQTAIESMMLEKAVWAGKPE